MLTKIQLLTEINREYGDQAARAVEALLEAAVLSGLSVRLAWNGNSVTIRVKPPSFRNPVSNVWLNRPGTSSNYGGTGYDAAFGADNYTRADAKPPPDHILQILQAWAAVCGALPSARPVPQNVWATIHAMGYADLARADHLEAVLAALKHVIASIQKEQWL